MPLARQYKKITDSGISRILTFQIHKNPQIKNTAVLERNVQNKKDKRVADKESNFELSKESTITFMIYPPIYA
jgi:hypothetical protein